MQFLLHEIIIALNGLLCAGLPLKKQLTR